MGSIGQLRRGSTITIALLLTVFALFLLAILVLIDYFLDFDFFPYGFIVLVLVCLGFILLQWLVSPAIVRWAARITHYLERQENPWLYDTVAKLAVKAQVPMPRIAIINDSTPNAFVFGRTLQSSTLAVHMGLLQQLSQTEIEAVLGHELGHLRNHDVITMTLVSAIPIIAYVGARGGLELTRSTGGSKGKGKGEGVALAIAIAILSYAVYYISQLLVLRLSRTREFYADSYSAAITGNPRHLRSALVKIAYGLSLAPDKSAPSGLRAFFIGDPVKAVEDNAEMRAKLSQWDLDRDGEIDEYELRKAMESEASNPWVRANELLSTHPPMYKRILLLEQLEEEFNKGRLPENIYMYV